VSGTYGITGSVDTTLVIQRKRLETFGKLVVTGRDVAEVEEPVAFNGMTWSQAARSLAEASFEQAEVYKVIEAEGPIFPKAIATIIGSTRDAVQKLVGKMVAAGSIARATGGYVVAGVRIVDDEEDAEGVDEADIASDAHSAHPRTRPHAPACVPTHSAHSSHSEGVDEGEEGAGTHVRVREAPEPALQVVPAEPTVWANTCFWYRDHRARHRWTPSGWTCDACHPEEEPSA
jgi:hypothetical protein